MSSMRAFRLTDVRTTELQEVPRPAPRASEVLVRVGGAGLCHSDLHVIRAAEAFLPMPLTLGHEIAGWVEEVGADVTGWAPGEPVCVYGILACGRCAACLRGLDNACRVAAPGGIGLGVDGGLAEFVAVPARNLVPLGDLDPVEAAPLTDAALTPYHAISRSRHALEPGGVAVVIGVGGLGHMAVQLLAATSATRIVAVDTDEGRLRLAQEVGAHHAVPSGEGAAEEILAITGPGGARAVYDCVGLDPTVALAAAVAGPGAEILLIGLGGGHLAVTADIAPVPRLETAVTIPFWGTRAELLEVVDLARAGHIRAHVERFGLDDTAEAYARLDRGEIDGRAVVVPA